MGAVFALFAGFYFWTPKIIGLTYNEFLGKVHFWTMFAGVKPNIFSLQLVTTILNKSNILSIINLFKLNRKISGLNYNINCLRFYSNKTCPTGNKSHKLEPWFITGFSDAESSFSVSCYKDNKLKIGWQLQPAYSIGLHKKDVSVLLLIQSFFGGVGRIKIDKNKAAYVVTRISDLNNVIIPHFKKYPLMGQKRADFILFNSIVELMVKKQHLNMEGFIKILAIKYHLNLGISEELKQILFAYIKSNPQMDTDLIVNRSIIKVTEKLDPNWVSGFVAGDGSFFVHIGQAKDTLTGYRVDIGFGIGLHSRDLNLLENLILYFKCGNINLNPTKPVVHLSVRKLSLRRVN